MFKFIQTCTVSVVAAMAFTATPVLAKAPKKVAGFRMPAALQAQLEGVKKQSRANRDKTAKAKSSECENFEGSWAGTCSDSDGETYDTAMVIEQYGCDELYMNDSFSMYMGGASSMDDLAHDRTFRLTFYPQWNSSRTGVTNRIVYSGRTLDEDVYFNGRGNMTLQIIGDKLVSRSATEVEFDAYGQVSVSHYTDECIYSKQD